MKYQDIIFEIKNNFAVLTINRPQCLNAMRMITKQEMMDAIENVNDDDSILGLIITGTGRAFSAGSDINEIHIDEAAKATEKMSRKAHVMMNCLEAMDKPVIAACNGFALGGGTELALACDIRIAADNAFFGLPEVDMGVAPCYGGTQRLPRLVGSSIAKEIMFSARKVSAQEALRIGLVNQVASPEKLMEEAEKMMQSFIKNSSRAIAVCKHLVDWGMDMPMEEALRLEAYMNGVLAESEDAKEGVQAFLEKRRPVFKNR